MKQSLRSMETIDPDKIEDAFDEIDEPDEHENHDTPPDGI